jgi:hypothetical protein
MIPPERPDDGSTPSSGKQNNHFTYITRLFVKYPIDADKYLTTQKIIDADKYLTTQKIIV